MRHEKPNPSLERTSTGLAREPLQGIIPSRGPIRWRPLSSNVGLHQCKKFGFQQWRGISSLRLARHTLLGAFFSAFASRMRSTRLLNTSAVFVRRGLWPLLRCCSFNVVAACSARRFVLAGHCPTLRSSGPPPAAA